MEEKKYERLMLSNQLCFPLYAAAKEIVRKYKPYLDEIDLTYTQYITMMLMWEHKQMNVRQLGECLYLDSGTLTPVLKKLQEKGFVTRRRSEKDERETMVTVTDKCMELRDKAVGIPEAMGKCVTLTPEEAGVLYKLLYRILGDEKG